MADEAFINAVQSYYDVSLYYLSVWICHSAARILINNIYNVIVIVCRYIYSCIIYCSVCRGIDLGFCNCI